MVEYFLSGWVVMTWKHAVGQYSMLAKVITPNEISVGVQRFTGSRNSLSQL